MNFPEKSRKKFNVPISNRPIEKNTSGGQMSNRPITSASKRPKVGASSALFNASHNLSTFKSFPPSGFSSSSMHDASNASDMESDNLLDCIGAIDGTHFRVNVPKEIVSRYQGRKEYPTQNVLAACTFDLKFTYIIVGWEGSASDSRILNDALTRVDKLVVPRGKYYLADGGFMLRPSFITPFRKTRYHIREYSTLQPIDAQELFNHRHSSLRNAIERAFGVLKKRFSILRSGTEPHYQVATQNKIILACVILHNYLMGVDPDEGLIREVDQDIFEQEMNEEDEAPILIADEEYKKGEFLRNSIVATMWRDYQI